MNGGRTALMSEMIGGEEGIAMAAQILTHMSGSEEDRIRYEDELIYELDMNTRFRQAESQGRSKGKLEGKQEIALQMLTKGYSFDDVIEITGFSKEDLEELKQKSKQ
jgi:predicted transposase/invertase (TIGR01784 family)